MRERLESLRKEYLEKRIAFVDKFFEGKTKPTHLYEIVDFHTLNEYAIDKIALFPSIIEFSFPVTEKTLESITNKLSNIVFDEAEIRVVYTKKVNETSFQQNVAYNYVLKGENKFSFDKEAIVSQMEEMRVLYEPKEGYTACENCAVQVLNESVMEYKGHKFCSDECKEAFILLEGK